MMAVWIDNMNVQKSKANQTIAASGGLCIGKTQQIRQRLKELDVDPAELEGAAHEIDIITGKGFESDK